MIEVWLYKVYLVEKEEGIVFLVLGFIGNWGEFELRDESKF